MMRRLILLLFSIGITTNVVLSSVILKSEQNEQEEETTVIPTTSQPGFEDITEAISSTVPPTTARQTSFQRAVRQIALLDSLSCLPRFICNLSTKPSAKTGIANDYGYLMKVLFERDDDDDDDDDDDKDEKDAAKTKKTKDKKKKKNSGSTRTGTGTESSKNSTGSSPATLKEEKDGGDGSSSKTKKKEESVSDEDSDESRGNGSDEEHDLPSKERPDYSEFDNLADRDMDEMIQDDIMDDEPEMLPYVLAEMREKAKKKVEAAAAKKKAAEDEALAKIKATLQGNSNTNTKSPATSTNTNSNNADIVPVSGFDLSSMITSPESESASTSTSTSETKNFKSKGSSKRNHNKDKSTSKKTSSSSSPSSTLYRQEVKSSHSSSVTAPPTRLSSSIIPGRIPGTYSSPYSSVPMYSATAMHSPVAMPSPVRRRHNIVHKLNKNVLNKFGFGFTASRPTSGTVLETFLPSFLYQKFKTGLVDDDDLDIPSSFYSTGSSPSGYGNSYRYGSGISPSSYKYPYGRNTKEEPVDENLDSQNVPDAVFKSSRQRLNSRFLRTFDEKKEAENADIQNFMARKSRELNMTTDPMEKYRVAIEAGKKTKSARQCRFLFSRCPYTGTEVQAMIKNFQSFVVAQKTVGDQEVQLKLKKKPSKTSSIIANDEPSAAEGGGSTGKNKGSGVKTSDIAGTPIVQNLPMGDFEIRLKLKPKDEVIEITMGGSSASVAMKASDVPANIREALESWTKNGGGKGSSGRKNVTVLSSGTDDNIFDEDDSPDPSLNSTSSSNSSSILDLNLNSTSTTSGDVNTTAAPDKAFSSSIKTHNMMEGGLPIIPSGPLPISAIYGTGSQTHHYRASEVIVDGKRRKGNYRNSTTNKQYVGDIKSSSIPTRAPISILPTLPSRYKFHKKSNGNSTNSIMTSTSTTTTITSAISDDDENESR